MTAQALAYRPDDEGAPASGPRVQDRLPETRRRLAALFAPAEARFSTAVVNTVAEFAVHHRQSEREADILALAAMRIHAKEGAARVGCHPSSHNTYWRRIIRKTGNGSRCEVLAALLSFSLQAPRLP
jgi:DNA-binding CsgD family transcriptional regulator